MNYSGVYVRALSLETGDALTVLAEHLTEESFKRFVLIKMGEAHLVVRIRDAGELETKYYTNRTKSE